MKYLTDANDAIVMKWSCECVNILMQNNNKMNGRERCNKK